MKKRFISLFLIAVFTVILAQAGALADEQPPSVVLSRQNLTLDGKPAACKLYNIDGSNYIGLRDLAYILKETGSQFSVNYDNTTNTVSLTTGKPYESNGRELTVLDPDGQSTVISSQTVQIDGKPVTNLSAYNIGGCNYFKLRELGSVLDFAVDFAAETNTVSINSLKAVNVSTALELLNDIAPNTKIILSPGTYNLSSVNIADVKNNYVSWETVFDGTEVVIAGVKNCTIAGSGSADSTSIVVKPRYADVLSFSSCSDISIKNLTVGHTVEQGYCTGGVLNFLDTKNIGINSCVLFGCGTLGLIMDKVVGLTATDTDIKDCTYGIMSANVSSSLKFDNCRLHDCGGYTMVTFDNCGSVSFIKCDIKNNIACKDSGDSLIFLSVCNSVSFNDCTISGNSMDYLIKVFNSCGVFFIDNSIEKNNLAKGTFADNSETNVVFTTEADK